MQMEHSQTIWFCRDCFFGHVILRRHNCFVSMLEVLLFLYQYELLSWIFRIWIFIPQLRRIILKLCQVALHIKNSVFIIYLLDDEQELSLGMLDTSPTYLWFLIAPCYIIFWFGHYCNAPVVKLHWSSPKVPCHHVLLCLYCPLIETLVKFNFKCKSKFYSFKHKKT